jgi:hypothetical protein
VRFTSGDLAHVCSHCSQDDDVGLPSSWSRYLFLLPVFSSRWRRSVPFTTTSAQEAPDPLPGRPRTFATASPLHPTAPHDT